MNESSESKDMSTLTDARRNLYFLLSGFLREVYDKPDLLSGGPFRLQDFRDIAERLLKLTLDHPDTSDRDKHTASKHTQECLELYEQYMSRPQDPLRDYSEERKSIEETATRFLRSNTA